MDRNSLQVVQHRNHSVAFCNSGVKLELFARENNSVRRDVYPARGLFASVNQVGKGFGISPNPPNSLENATNAKFPAASMQMKFVVIEPAFPVERTSEPVIGEVLEVVGEKEVVKKKKKASGFKWKIKVGNQALRRLISGGVAGAVSRTAVAPLETIRTHLMVGNCGHSSMEVFDNIMKSDGWKGLFRGNFVNVIRVAPSKAIELFAYDTVLKHLTPKPGEQPIIPIPASSIAGAVAGISSTLITYPLELLKTRLTVQRGVYNNFVDAFLRIVREEGPAELYRGLTPSLIGVVPYAAANYFAYDTLRKAYKKAFKKEEIGNVMTLLIGSAAGAFSSTASFPLEVARKHMQAGALNGRQYQNMLHALASILEKEGLGGLYRGLGPSCMKLVPAAGISFMCYEACKRILIVEEEDS
ncbi:adenine nucleotide transporter BT1, chloroplastic/mitochondrial [Ricinus communis]|uniref:Mitochondrial deoxynucleotide carrier, putative n=1 Tax=Ricinus communis TaxID=3988 RepID=B9SEQ4_RICCO|nr:adenine nucleotide transporter BT1, chloroplastic/mitochondrial [Ricinus communis]EEF37913.1 Mitochondrial deoxynucleotide carrier, putative [Ricinus communis]|eukprot:XP_002524473.1 adenine nucleotide transporter BT1, chloroplastic/mitochondrial [Ricinus communis]